MRAAELAALELEQDEENPGPRASMGQFQRVVPLDPSSRIVVGWEDSTAGLLTNHSRQESIVVAEIASLRLDFDQTVPGLMSLPPVKSMSAARMLRARPASLRGGGLGCARYRVRDN